MINIQSKIGGRSENQDFYGSAQTQWGNLIIVCDGMGGAKGGRYAAEMAVHIIIDNILKSEELDPVNALQKAIENANASIWEESRSNESVKGMGSTLVALLITTEKAICCHVGDSRIYQLRNGKIAHRTFDHSQVFEMVHHGIITEEQARLSEKSNVITRALGIRPSVELETTDNLDYKKGDRFLLCTDGICGAIPENQLLEMVNEKGNIETVLTNMVEKIDAIGFANGGKHDNLTAALVEMESDSLRNGIKDNSTQHKVKPLKIIGKRLIFMLVLILGISLAANFYFLLHKKYEPKPNENVIESKPNNIENNQIPDTTQNITPDKK